MSDVQGIGKRLKALREQRELTMDMVVYSMNKEYNLEITKGNLSRWENGVNFPTLYYAAYLANFYGTSLDYLIGNTDIKTPPDLLARTRKRGGNNGNS